MDPNERGLEQQNPNKGNQPDFDSDQPIPAHRPDKDCSIADDQGQPDVENPDQIEPIPELEDDLSVSTTENR